MHAKQQTDLLRATMSVSPEAAAVNLSQSELSFNVVNADKIIKKNDLNIAKLQTKSKKAELRQ